MCQPMKPFVGLQGALSDIRKALVLIVQSRAYLLPDAHHCLASLKFPPVMSPGLLLNRPQEN